MIKKLSLVGSIILLIVLSLLLIINGNVIKSTRDLIINDKIEKITDIDCVLVLGAGIWGDKPSPMLEDRLNAAIKLYKDGVTSKIIMSGDHGKDEYDEVNVMKEYAIENGVLSEDIFMDHAGFSTYDSIYRAKEIFKVNKIIIVTQKYHLYRALYIANALGIDAYGYSSDSRRYAGQKMRDLREILARDKDFIKCIFKPKPKFLGEIIPVFGNGDYTNDH